ncbi:MAG: hypothetical protein CUN55_01390 [Phototrophicales bacterium]|nr:MAG: hypothetical protein CUN55_01390 [Phototrophicales bacterium]
MSEFPSRLGDTRPLDEKKIEAIDKRPQVVTLSDEIPSAWSVRFIATNHAIPIQLKVDSKATIGRKDPDSGYTPDIDLSPYDALSHGVSRRHAELIAGKDFLVLIDRGSTNGTQLNGYALQPNEPYKLQHGDSLTIGTMHLEVFISIMPIHDGVKRVRKNTAQLGKSDPSEKDYTTRRVLIVDDDDNVTQSLKAMVSQLGYEVLTVTTIGDAMRSIALELPDCVIVDMDMPGNPATEIPRLIKEDLSNVHIPLFIISNAPDEEKIRESFDAGADIFLSKPLGFDELRQGLRDFVGDPKIR